MINLAKYFNCWAKKSLRQKENCRSFEISVRGGAAKMETSGQSKEGAE